MSGKRKFSLLTVPIISLWLQGLASHPSLLKLWGKSLKLVLGNISVPQLGLSKPRAVKISNFQSS